MTTISLGVIGLGRAFLATAPALLAHPTIRIAGVADPRPEARAAAGADFGVPAHDDAEALCRDPAIDAVYIASPHQFHADHVELCARHGKHILVEKPMALTLAECDRMIAAAERAGVALVVGPTHSFDPPVRAARELIRSGRLGSLRMISGWAFTDFLYRPRRPEELDTAQGGGVLFSQAPHHVDVVRLLAGGLVRSVRSIAGAWDRRRSTESAYATLLEFESGVAATLVYSGYGHFDSDEFDGWVGEGGHPKSPADHGAARRLLASHATNDEAQLKGDTGYGGPLARALRAGAPKDAIRHPHFGVLIASCDRADIRTTPDGLCVYEDLEVSRIPVPKDRDGEGRGAVLDELASAIAGRTPLHDGRWGKATLEVCLAMLESSRERREVHLVHQCAPNE
jgi:phthalate 4,5-cis-dihydrodiol dehydrogenase